MPFDFSSFFTPRFPVIKRDRRDDILLPTEELRTPYGPELPPNFYGNEEINIGGLGELPDKYFETPKIPKYHIEKPKPIKYPTVAETLAPAVKWATDPISEKHKQFEEKIIKEGYEKFGDVGGWANQQYFEGSTSPIGIAADLADWIPVLGPVAKYGAGKLAGLGGKWAAGKLAGEIGAAGIPFLKLGKKLELPEVLGKPVVWRGDPGFNSTTRQTYKEINPQYFNLRDTLGQMGHAAEDQDYAVRSYMFREGSPYMPNQTEHHGYEPRARPNLTAVTAPSSRNAVDLTKLPEDPVDVEKLVRGLEMWQPRRSAFGEADRLNTRQKALDVAEEIPHLWRLQQPIDKKLREGIPLTMRERNELSHIGDRMDDIRIPLNDPEIVDKLGFDAIRYSDIGNTSWAFPDVSKMETPWGTKLGSQSMGEYRYRVTTPAASGKESVGFFKTDEEAMRAASEYGPGYRVYRGSRTDADPMAIIRGPKNINVERNRIPGLESYFENDEKIQDRLKALEIKPVKLNAGQTLLQDGYAKSMYHNKYDDLNDWQKWDVDTKLKNDQKSIGVVDDLEDKDFEFDENAFLIKDDLHDEQFKKATSWSEDPHNKKNKLLMQLENEVASDKYGKDFNQLTDNEKQTVFDEAEKMYQDGDYDTPVSQVKGKIPASPMLQEKLQHKIAVSDYADMYDNLDVEGKKNVNDILDDILKVKTKEDIDQVYKNWPSMKAELDQLYGPPPTTDKQKLSGSGWQHYSGPTPGKYSLSSFSANEADEMALHHYNEKYNILLPSEQQALQKAYKAGDWYDTGPLTEEAFEKIHNSTSTMPFGDTKSKPYDYDKLTPNQKSILADLEANKKVVKASMGGVKDDVYVVPKGHAHVVEEVKDLFKSGASYDEAAQLYYGTDYDSLSKAQQKVLKDFEDSTISKGTAQKSKTYKVTPENIKKFANDDFSADEIAVYYYGKNLDKLDIDEAKFIAAVHYKAQVYQAKK